MKTGWPEFALWALASLLLFLGGCAGSAVEQQMLERQKPAVSPLALAGSTAELLPPVIKLAGDTSGDFAANRDGSEFAADLPNNRCTVAGSNALLEPNWQPESPNERDNAAFCLYRLRLYQTLDSATLTIEWDGEAPVTDTCWIGLPDWQRMCWTWQLLDESSAISLAEPARHANAEDQCYAAVMVLAAASLQLARIGFGDIDPPEPPAQYNLFDPLYDHSAYLVDMEGNLVHSWTTTRLPATCSYLLANGHLLRPGSVTNPAFHGAGSGGIIEELDWDSNVVWSYTLSSDTVLMHHDIEPLPNGNILAIAWERKTKAEMVSAGRRPDLIPFTSCIIDAIFEIQPAATGGGEIVWEWHLWDHLIQEYSPDSANFGAVAEHPELVDFNFPQAMSEDFSHFNAVAYNAELDQIAVTASLFDEIWIIDHGTTTPEAASHSGGACGRGGDLLYRWGNPAAYQAGASTDQRLFGGHNVQWIAPNMPGAGNLLVFNNGMGRPGGNFSSVDEIITPLEPDGTYGLEEGQAYDPLDPSWRFVHDPPKDFFSWYISGAQRLPSGNTVICSGADGWFFEVTPAGELVWEYQNPYTLQGGYAVFRMTRLYGDYAGLASLLPAGV
jgi:hypothetical protein